MLSTTFNLAAIKAAMRKLGEIVGTPSYYDVARKTLWAEWGAGHDLNKVKRAPPGPRKDMSQPETQSGFYALINDHDLDKNTA